MVLPVARYPFSCVCVIQKVYKRQHTAYAVLFSFHIAIHLGSSLVLIRLHHLSLGFMVLLTVWLDRQSFSQYPVEKHVVLSNILLLQIPAGNNLLCIFPVCGGEGFLVSC